MIVDENRYESPTHKVDCVKEKVALEVEWNNKDPFFDRDLNNFRQLFELRAIDVGVIVTRATHLQSLFNDLGRGASFGNSTTHMDKLRPAIQRVTFSRRPAPKSSEPFWPTRLGSSQTVQARSRRNIGDCLATPR